MKRYAAHYIYISPEIICKQHYIELDDKNCIRGIFPLTSEIPGTEFYNGILFPVSKEKIADPEEIRKNLLKTQQADPQASVFELLNSLKIVESGQDIPVCIYRLDGINLPAAKLCTSDGRCNSYIQRL